MRRTPWHRFSLLVALAGVACSVFGAGSAAAAGPPPAPGVSAVWQYTEVVPTSRGPALEKNGRAKETQLPVRVASALAHSSSPVDHVLRKAATSPSYGAPAAVVRAKTPKHPRRPARSSRIAGEPVNASSAGYGGDARFVVLVALMGAGLAAALGFRVLARRRPPRPRR